MQKFKKIMALALAMVMVIGGSMTAFAEEPTSGSSTGAGTSEGHVDKHVIKVVLPTVADGTTPFAYTMDAERLIQETTNAKYANATFPAKETDTGVYFVTGKNADSYVEVEGLETGDDVSAYYTTADQVEYVACGDGATSDGTTTYYEKKIGGNIYANTSSALTVTSQSSDKVVLTVEVEASQADTDIALVATAPAEEVTDPQLYLALQLDGTNTAVQAGEKITKTVEIAGVESNFETVYADGAYKFAPKAGDLTWNSESFTLTGAVSKATVASTTTAPTLTVTWSYADPAAVPAAPENVAPSMTDVEYAGTGDLVIPYSVGSGDLEATALTDVVFQYGDTKFSKEGTWNSNTNQAANITIGEDSITIATTLAEYIATGVEDGTEYTFYLIFDGDTENFVTGKVTIATE